MEEMNPRIGKWKVYYHGGTDFSYSCNQCGAQAPFFWMSNMQRKSYYCYNCGAKMENAATEDEIWAYNKLHLSSLYGKCMTDGEEI